MEPRQDLFYESLHGRGSNSGVPVEEIAVLGGRRWRERWPHAPVGRRVIATLRAGGECWRRRLRLLGRGRLMEAATRVRVRYFLAFWLFVLSGVAFLDRTNISIAGLADLAGVWARQPAAGMDLQRVSAGVCGVPGAGGMAGGALWAAPRADIWSAVVGRRNGS